MRSLQLGCVGDDGEAAPGCSTLALWVERSGRRLAMGPSRGGLRFAFYGRVSTKDWQDPVTSRARQREQAAALTAGHGTIVAEFFDAGQSRTVAWGRRPQAAALVAALADPDRGWDASKRTGGRARAGQVSAACSRSVTMLAMPTARLPVASCSIMRSTCSTRTRSLRRGSAGSMPAPAKNAGQAVSSTPGPAKLTDQAHQGTGAQRLPRACRPGARAPPAGQGLARDGGV